MRNGRANASPGEGLALLSRYPTDPDPTAWLGYVYGAMRRAKRADSDSRGAEDAAGSKRSEETRVRSHCLEALWYYIHCINSSDPQIWLLLARLSLEAEGPEAQVSVLKQGLAVLPLNSLLWKAFLDSIDGCPDLHGHEERARLSVILRWIATCAAAGHQAGVDQAFDELTVAMSLKMRGAQTGIAGHIAKTSSGSLSKPTGGKLICNTLTTGVFDGYLDILVAYARSSMSLRPWRHVLHWLSWAETPLFDSFVPLFMEGCEALRTCPGHYLDPCCIGEFDDICGELLGWLSERTSASFFPAYTDSLIKLLEEREAILRSVLSVGYIDFSSECFSPFPQILCMLPETVELSFIQRRECHDVMPCCLPSHVLEWIANWGSRCPDDVLTGHTTVRETLLAVSAVAEEEVDPVSQSARILDLLRPEDAGDSEIRPPILQLVHSCYGILIVFCILASDAVFAGMWSEHLSTTLDALRRHRGKYFSRYAQCLAEAYSHRASTTSRFDFLRAERTLTQITALDADAMKKLSFTAYINTGNPAFFLNLPSAVRTVKTYLRGRPLDAEFLFQLYNSSPCEAMFSGLLSALIEAITGTIEALTDEERRCFQPRYAKVLTSFVSKVACRAPADGIVLSDLVDGVSNLLLRRKLWAAVVPVLAACFNAQLPQGSQEKLRGIILAVEHTMRRELPQCPLTTDCLVLRQALSQYYYTFGCVFDTAHRPVVKETMIIVGGVEYASYGFSWEDDGNLTVATTFSGLEALLDEV